METISIPRFAGINEQPGADLSQVADAYNVEFVNGSLQRMRGLELLAYSRTCKPARILRAVYDAANLVYDFTSAATYGDHTATLTDGSAATTIDVGGATGTMALFVGMPFPFWAIKITTVLGNTTAATIAVALNTASGFLERAPTSDGTASVGTFAHEGVIDFSGAAFTVNEKSQWVPTTIMGQKLYWARLRISAGGPLDVPTTISEVRVPLLASSNAAWPSLIPNAVYTWQRPYGGKRTFVALDSAGYYNMGGTANALAQLFTGDAKLIEYDENDSSWRAVQLPYAAFGSHPGARWTFAAFGVNGIVATNGYGPPVMITDSKVAALQGAQGTDKQTGSYLGNPPWGAFLAVCQSRLAIAGGPITPYTIFWSSPADGPLETNTALAPLRGANHWPSDQNIDVGMDTGHKINGLASTGGELVALTTDAVWRGVPPFINKVTDAAGCVAPGTVLQIGPTVFYLGSDGFFGLMGAQVTKLSGAIEPSFKHLALRPHLFVAHAAIYKKKTQIKLWIESFKSAGGGSGQLQYVYDYSTSAWSKHDSQPELRDQQGFAIGAASGYTTDAGDEVLLLAGVENTAAAASPIFNLWRGDTDYRYRYLTSADAAASLSAPQPLIVTQKLKLNQRSRMLVRSLGLLADTTGATFMVMPLFDETEWRTIANEVSPYTQQLALSEPLDVQYTGAGDHAAAISVSSGNRWRGKRQVWQRASFSRKCEYVQFVISNTLPAGTITFFVTRLIGDTFLGGDTVEAPLPFTVSSLELEYQPIAGKPTERLRNT